MASTQMDPRRSLGEYPRKDTYYKNKSSLNFDVVRSRIFMREADTKCDRLHRWISHGLVGMATGTIAFMMATVEDWMTTKKSGIAQDWLSDGRTWEAYAYYTCFAVICAFIASVLTVYIGPGANGSGIAEIMGILNGVNYKGVIGLRTGIVKIVGVVLAVVGSLCVGKEGPLAHIGTIVAMCVIYLPYEGFRKFQNDHEKRQFIAAGASAGVSAAFGSPIGGALFTFEISKPTTFWTFSMLWLVFFASAISTLTLAILTNLYEGQEVTLSSASVLKFGNVTQLKSPISNLPSAIILGTITGIMGAGFIDVNTRMALIRKKYVNTPFKKILETSLFSLATASTFYLVAANAENCQKQGDIDREYFRGQCPEGEYSPIASLLFNTEGGTIRAIMNNALKTTYQEITGFIAIWYFFTITTYGVNAPSGLFLPGIIIGCALGQFYFQIFFEAFPGSDPTADQSYKIMAASAMLGGYTRLTYSLCVIMLETTQSINYFIPIMFSVLTSVTVGDWFNRSLYERALRAKQIPLLRNYCPWSQKDVTAYQIMSQNPMTVEGIIAVQYLQKILTSGYSMFPVMNSSGNMIGIIPKNFMIVLIENHHWVDVNQLDTLQKGRLPKLFRRSSASDLSDQMGPMAQNNDDWFNEKSLRLDRSSDNVPNSFMAGQQSPDEINASNHHFSSISQPVDEDGKESVLKDGSAITNGGFAGSSIMEKEVEKRKKTLHMFTGLSDAAQIPKTRDELAYYYFNTDFYSNDREYSEVEDICEANSDKMIDVRPYMIETPFLAQSTDKLQKILDVFRHMHLRMLAVTNPGTGELEGIITRQDLFAFMSL